MQLPGPLSKATWYGRGPHESYWDRKTGARVGLYEKPVDDLHFPYVMPQENGNRADVRWIALTGEDGLGLRVSAEGAAQLHGARLHRRRAPGGEADGARSRRTAA